MKLKSLLDLIYVKPDIYIRDEKTFVEVRLSFLSEKECRDWKVTGIKIIYDKKKAILGLKIDVNLKRDELKVFKDAKQKQDEYCKERGVEI